MHRYRIVAQISLILSILNLVLAAPIVVQEIHGARGDDSKTAVAEDVPAMPETSDELEAASDRPMSPPPSQDAMASLQHSSLSDGSTSSGYPTPYLSSFSSDSGYSWLRDRPPRLSLNLPASLLEPASQHEPSLLPSSSVPSELPLPARFPPGWGEWSPLHPSSSGSSELPLPAWYLHGLAPQRSQSHPEWWEWTTPSSSGSSEIPPPPYVELPPGITATSRLQVLDWMLGLAPQIPQSPEWWEWPTPHPSSSGPSEIPPSPQRAGSDVATTETYSSQDEEFTPSHHLSSSTDWSSDDAMPTPYSSASDGSLHSLYFSASDGLAPSHDSMPEGLAPSLTPDGSPPSLSSPPTETPPDSAGFFNENMIKKLKIVAGLVIIGGVIASVAGSQIKHRDCQDS